MKKRFEDFVRHSIDVGVKRTVDVILYVLRPLDERICGTEKSKLGIL